MNVSIINYSANNAAQKLSESLRVTGFAVLTNHPIDIELIKKVYAEWKIFFSSSRKHDFKYEKPKQDGYFPLQTEKAKDNDVRDLKEFFHFYPDGKIPAELKEITNAIYVALSKLSAQILQWIEDCLPQEVSRQLSMPLQEMIHNSPYTLLRVLHYPPLSEKSHKAIRAAPHEDINLITLLPAATSPGLEVLSANNEWHSIDCNPGNLVINAGDMLQMCTKDYYSSTTHRVINPDCDQNESRFSMPLFLHPRSDVRLSENLTAGEYLNQRLKEIGIH